jgi:hypothetical protein
MYVASDVIGAFQERVRRHVNEALRQYQDELRAVSSDMASRGLANSGPHLKRRIEVLHKATQALTDKCLEDVTHLPGTQQMHRTVHAGFLSQQLHEFFSQAEGDVFIPNVIGAAHEEVKRQVETIRQGINSDVREFQAELWRPRVQGLGSSVTNNTVNVHESTIGSIQQAGDGSAQTASSEFNMAAASEALEAFAMELERAQLSGDVRNAVRLELETIRPQLKKSAPNKTILNEGLRSVRTILEGVASAALWAAFAALCLTSGVPPVH